jgi:hypothetical protein
MRNTTKTLCSTQTRKSVFEYQAVTAILQMCAENREKETAADYITIYHPRIITEFW